MQAPSLSIFLDFSLPNGTTWFYFSLLLAIALFFKFGRLLSIRNGDVVALFVLVPGLLVIQGARPGAGQPAIEHPAVQAVALIGQSYAPPNLLVPIARVGAFAQLPHPAFAAGRWLWLGYLWLMCGSIYFFCRGLFDLALVQRPALNPNLSFGGLAWLAGAMLICLMAVAFRSVPRPTAALPAPESVAAYSAGAAGAVDSATKAGPGFMVGQGLAPPRWVLRLFAVLCHVAIVLGLVVIGWRHFADAAAGMAAATFYLMLPYTGMFVGEMAHAWPAALLVWAVAAYRYPTLAGMLLGLATGTAFFPLVVLPAWVSFYSGGRGAGRFLFAWLVTLGLCLANLSLMSTGLFFDLSAWLPWQEPRTEGFWMGVHTAYRLPVFIAYLAFVLATAVWPSPKNLARLLGLCVATLAGLQLWYADHGGIYVLWYAPLLLLLAFRPNLQDHRPALIEPASDWLARSRRWLMRMLRRIAKVPEPAQTHRA